MIYNHFDDIPMASWHIKYFLPSEIACKGTNQIFVNNSALLALDHFRSLVGRPIKLSSAYRSVYHNAKIGGAPKSSHTMNGSHGACAFDVVLTGGLEKDVIRKAALASGFRGFGMNYQTFDHIDMGRRRDW